MVDTETLGKKILILAANPKGDLAINREIRELQSIIKRSRRQDSFNVATGLATRSDDLQELMLEHQPQIVHFCGHGSEAGLMFENDTAQGQLISTAALSGLFELFKQRGLECVLLNACYSEAQANAIVQSINYVIGMKQAIQDNAAIAFAKGFYWALSYDWSIEEAFKFACNSIQLNASGSGMVRSTQLETSELDTQEAYRKLQVVEAIDHLQLPEHLKPILKINPMLDRGQTSEQISGQASRSPASETAIARSTITAHSPAESNVESNAKLISLFVSASGVDYRNLQNYLKAHRWQDADSETRRIMLDIAQRQSEGWLGEADIRQFPCADLQQIDRLWTTYSNGRFGFSVQRDIFLQSGGQLQGKHNETAWKTFGDRVGWVKAGTLIPVEELRFEISEPVGHLPFQVYWGGGCFLFGTCVLWAARFDACQL